MLVESSVHPDMAETDFDPLDPADYATGSGVLSEAASDGTE